MVGQKPVSLLRIQLDAVCGANPNRDGVREHALQLVKLLTIQLRPLFRVELGPVKPQQGVVHSSKSRKSVVDKPTQRNGKKWSTF